MDQQDKLCGSSDGWGGKRKKPWQDFNVLINIVRRWLPIAVAIVCLSGMVDLAVQQNIRLSANNPQIQMAEDFRPTPMRVRQLEAATRGSKVDLAQSLAPFTMVFTETGKPIASSALLYRSIPTVPDGVFPYTKAHGEDRFTWQPAPGVRIAAVLVYHPNQDGKFVLAGRSLREVEYLEDHVLADIGIALAFTLAATLATVIFLEQAASSRLV
jgi:hypothetical protein